MRQWFVTDTGLKIVALVLAAITWFFVRALINDTRAVEGVRLQIRTASGLEVSSTSAGTINVTLRGATEDLRMASRDELFAVLDLAHITEPGRVEVPLSTKVVRPPRRVQVVSVDPASVVVRLEKSTE